MSQCLDLEIWTFFRAWSLVLEAFPMIQTDSQLSELLPKLAAVDRIAVDTGSKMDQVIFEEFKGTGNMELHLDRALVEKRLYPAIHCLQSATRREDLLYHPEEWERVQLVRKAMAALPPIEAMEKLIDNLNATKTNAELLLSGLR